MKLFEIPMLAMSLLGFGLLSGIDAPPAHADFTFGERVNLKSVIPVIDTTYGNIACLSYDGLEVYTGLLVKNLPGGDADWDLCVQKRVSTDAAWGPPQNLGPVVNSTKEESCASISANGLVLFFSSSRAGGYGYFDIYMTTRASKTDPWGPPTNLGPTVNSSAADTMCRISADGLELYFASWRSGGYGDGDIYVAKRATVDGPWGKPVNLGPTVNSAYGETQLFLSSDSLLLLFGDNWLLSPRPGGYSRQDIWMTKRASLSAPWEMPVNLGSRLNEAVYNYAPCISPDGRTLYYNTASTVDPSTWNTWQVPIIPTVDFNADGKVDANDQAILKAHLGQNSPLCDIAPFAWGNGVVDANDLAVLSDYIGKELVDPTLLAHWALDESAGSVAQDRVGGHDAMIVGKVVWQPAGKVGGALSLDGKENFMRALTPVLDPSSGPFSVIAWVKGGAASRVIVSQVGGADWLYLNQSGLLTTDLKTSGPEAQSLTSAAYVPDDGWHRVGLVWDGMNRSLYMDGVEVARDTQPSLAASSGNLQIGCGKAVAPTTLWSGLIDDVRIYSRVTQP